MALKYSTCLRNKMLGGVPARHVATYTATTIAAVDGGAGADSFTDSANGFLTAGFSVGDAILAIGFTGGMANIVGPFTIVTVAAGTIEVATGLLAADAAAESVTLVALAGGSLRDVFKDFVIGIYTGAQPSSPDLAATGTLLGWLTVDAGAFVHGAVANGLEFGVASGGAIGKSTTQDWELTAIAEGVAGWFRAYANPADAGGADTTFIYPRIDGTVATSGGQLNLSSLNFIVGTPATVTGFTITMREDNT
jgi:hypothetical protein